MYVMLNSKLYEIGKKYNTVVKHNINYDRGCTLDYQCAVCINELLLESHPLDMESKSKLQSLLNNLITL